MTGIERSAAPTVCTPAELRDALMGAWRAYFGVWPSPGSIAVLMAQWALETGRGKSCHGWNLANEKYPGSVELGAAGDWYWLECWEIIHGQRVIISPPDRGACWRWYPCLADGAAAYLRSLVVRYAPAWHAVIAGDPRLFVDTIHNLNYFTGDLAEYRTAVTLLWHEFIAIAEPVADVTPSAVAVIDGLTLIEQAWPDMLNERSS